MKTVKMFVFAAAITLVAAAGCSQRKKVEGVPPAQVDTLSYLIGHDFGRQMQSSGLDLLDVNLIAQAIRDAFNGKDPRYEMDDMRVRMLMREVMQKAQDAAKAGNVEAGKKFLEENKKDINVVELPSGLQYKMITEGAGATPAAEDTVKVHYKGTLVDGREFDSSYKRNEPTTFPLNGVIKGWSEGLQQAKEGAKIMLYIPSELAYGDHPMPGSIITPGATLIFEVELLEVRKAAPAATETPAAE